jgi:hypothetical protein
LYEAAIIAREPEEGADRSRHRLAQHCLDLLLVHGDASRGDHVAKVGHRMLAERLLGPLDEEVVFLELGEDQLDMTKVLCPRGVVDHYVVKKYKHKTV